MEKTTKKKKKTKSARKRIGIIAVGGLSLVLTICLSVGATLAWFAGSTWSSNQLYMGGPVYVEMAGRGASGTTAGEDDGSIAKWQGGAGNLDIRAATSRTTGTATDNDNATATPSSIPNNILLPGQKFEIYSQARVFSTSYTTSVGQNTSTSMNSGSNVTNTTKGDGTAHITDKGRVTSTTTSVLRARFSVNVEFDPTVGFNNFTQASYYSNYPVQSGVYNGDVGNEEETLTGQSLAWNDALNKPSYKGKFDDWDDNETTDDTLGYPETSRRDAIPNTNDLFTNATSDNGGDLTAIKNGTKKSIYAWKFVSSDVYTDETLTASADMIDDAETQTEGVASTYKYIQMAAPFNGPAEGSTVGYYGVWILKTNAAGKNCLSESDSFYKARCNAYIDSYVEEYITEYGEVKTRTIGDSLASLENSLNQSFIDLVNASSNKILTGYVNGMTVENGIITYIGDSLHPTNASWLYIDPTIGNDTNTNELSTSAGGWWYLVASDNGPVGDETTPNRVAITKDSVTDGVNTPTVPDLGSSTQKGNWFTRNTDKYGAADDDSDHGESRLDAMLYEINPLLTPDFDDDDTAYYAENGDDSYVKKIVSYSFPFVNGTAALPGDALTNVFANAKITIQISFQALQAFFPYSTNIDNMQYTDPLLGTAKALSIRNAIPIFNEAFDYQETVSVSEISGL